MDSYPTIRFIVERGNLLAIVIGLLPLLGAVALVILGVHWFALVAGAVAAAVVFFLMKSYVELVRVIADMLLPK
jgi:membrane-associated phospholipid phosphatase